MIAKNSTARNIRKYPTPQPKLLQRFSALYPQLLTPTATCSPLVKVKELETRRGWVDVTRDGKEPRWDGSGQVAGFWTEDEVELLEEGHREAMEEMWDVARMAEFFLSKISHLLEIEQAPDVILEEVTRRLMVIRHGYGYGRYEMQQFEEEGSKWGEKKERLEAQVMEMMDGGCQAGLGMTDILLKKQGYYYDTRRSELRKFHQGRAKKARKNKEVANADVIKLLDELKLAKQTIRRLEKEVAEAKGELGEGMNQMAETWQENHRLKARIMELQMALPLRRSPDPTPAKTIDDGDCEMKDWSPDEKFAPVTPPRIKTEAAQPPPAPRKPTFAERAVAIKCWRKCLGSQRPLQSPKHLPHSVRPQTRLLRKPSQPNPRPKAHKTVAIKSRQKRL